MRRTIVGLAATALLALAGPASAATGQVTKFRFSGPFADALWSTGSATSSTATSINVSKTTQGSQLFVDQFTVNFDANGFLTGATDTSAAVTSGFSFALPQSLANASLSALGLPTTTCTYDANLNLVGCTSTTIDVSLSWTGQGPITRGVQNDHVKSDGFSETDHFNGTFRNAAASGTVAGLTLTASDGQADVGTTKSGTITRCIGNSC